MRCSNPIYALDLGVKENGKRNIKILPRRVDLSSFKQLSARYGEANIIPLPCGKCLNCKINHANEWAVRCVLESKLHENNYFITLTFDDAHLPADKKQARREIQLFFKRLRNEVGSFRYFGCCEKGKQGSQRFHYHIIFFGLFLNDLKANNFHQLKSSTLDKVWSLGLYDIGEMTYASANYVAQYAVKKVFGSSDDEFIFMSNRPGIGADWLQRNKDKCFQYDQVFGSFGSMNSAKMPRYFDKLLEAIDPEAFEDLKDRRGESSSLMENYEMNLHSLTEVEKLLDYKQDIVLADFINRKRGIRKDL